MKHRFFSVLFIMLFSKVFYGQKVITDIFTPATVLIQFSNGASGSGIVVVDTNYMYLITARHVLFNYNKDSSKFLLEGKDAYLICYRNNAFNDVKDSLRLDLQKLYNEKLVQYHPQQDIAIVKIAKVIRHSTASDGRLSTVYDYSAGVTKMRPENLDLPGIYVDLLIKFDEVDPGEDALLFGYPKALKLSGDFNYDYDRPLLRKGIIAGIDKSLSTIVVDCPVYQGNSGGPVFEVSIEGKNRKVGLIGIVSRSILQVEYLENKYYRYNNVNLTNSGYTVVTPISFALDLMK